MKYEIPEEVCNCADGMEDFCCACWCGCCAIAQVARHEYEDPETGEIKYKLDPASSSIPTLDARRGTMPQVRQLGHGRDGLGAARSWGAAPDGVLRGGAAASRLEGCGSKYLTPHVRMCVCSMLCLG